MRTARVSIRLFIAGVGLVVIAGCTRGPGNPTHTTRPSNPTTTKPTAPVLVDYHASGGLCPVRRCGTDLTIYRNGAWHARFDGRVADGQLHARTLGDLIQRVDGQIGTLRDLKPTGGLCPSAYDGSDITVTFHAGRTSITVTNCDQRNRANSREIPGDNPLLRYTTQLIPFLSVEDAPTPGRILVDYQESGGDCREICPEERVTIGSDGIWTATTGPTSTSGVLSASAISELERRMYEGVPTLAGLPASSGCPSAYDGRDIEITFRTDLERVTSVSNCDKDIEGSAFLNYARQLVDDLVPT
jgi:hypothetical protein